MSTRPRTGSKRIYYPFWAAGASASALDRSSGGPSAEGATLVHWLVAAGTVVVSYVVIRSMERLAGERCWVLERSTSGARSLPSAPQLELQRFRADSNVDPLLPILATWG